MITKLVIKPLLVSVLAFASYSRIASCVDDCSGTRVSEVVLAEVAMDFPQL